MILPAMPPTAAAQISGNPENPSMGGTVQFYPTSSGVLVIAQLTGLPESESGIFAMHIHEGSSCEGKTFSNAAGHLNPGGRPHPEHAGDLPPVFRCRNGNAYLALVSDRFSLEDVIGRTVIIHSAPDDFRTQPAGNSGNRIGCGVIRRN